jgi:hypothetical protein
MQRDPRDQEILNEKGEHLYSCVFKAAICVKLPQAVTSSTGFGFLPAWLAWCRRCAQLLRIARCDTTWCAEGRTFNAALIVQAGAVVTPPAFHSNFRGGTVCLNAGGGTVCLNAGGGTVCLNPIFDERVEKHVARWPFACSGRQAATTVRWAGGQTVNAAHSHQRLCSGMHAATTRWWAGGDTVTAA